MTSVCFPLCHVLRNYCSLWVASMITAVGHRERAEHSSWARAVKGRSSEGAVEDVGLCAWAAGAACGVTGQSPRAGGFHGPLGSSWDGLLARWFREYAYKSCRECGQHFSPFISQFLSWGASAQHGEEGPALPLSPRGLKAWGWMNLVTESLAPENSHPDASQ